MGSGAKGARGAGGLQSLLVIPHHTAGSGAPLHSQGPQQRLSVSSLQFAGPAKSAVTAGHPDGQQGPVQRHGQPVSPALIAGKGPSLGNRAHGGGRCLCRRGLVFWGNQVSLTKRAAAEVWEKRAVFGLAFDSEVNCQHPASPVPGLGSVGAAFAPHHEHRLCHLSPPLTSAWAAYSTCRPPHLILPSRPRCWC